MAIKTYYKRGTTGAASYSAYGNARNVIVQEVDIAKVISEEGAIASGDLIALAVIPNKSKVIVHSVYNKTALVLGTSGVLELGDAALGGSGDDDRYVANTTTMTADFQSTIEAAGSTGTTYNVADVLSIKLSNSGGTITSGKIVVAYEIIDLTSPQDNGTPTF